LRHLPDRPEAPFDIVYNLYSIPHNERVRLKVATTAAEGVESVAAFAGGKLDGARGLRSFWIDSRIIQTCVVCCLPPDWKGIRMRKDYPLEFVENEWTANHLPEMTDVQTRQLEQRRGYGLRFCRCPKSGSCVNFSRAVKEVMPKDK